MVYFTVDETGKCDLREMQYHPQCNVICMNFFADDTDFISKYGRQNGIGHFGTDNHKGNLDIFPF